jgi:hypothetical protein
LTKRFPKKLAILIKKLKKQKRQKKAEKSSKSRIFLLKAEDVAALPVTVSVTAY